MINHCAKLAKEWFLECSVVTNVSELTFSIHLQQFHEAHRYSFLIYLDDHELAILHSINGETIQKINEI